MEPPRAWPYWPSGSASGTLYVTRLKGSIDSTHSLDRDELRDLRKLRQHATGLYVFETERGGPPSVDALQYIVREAGRAAKLDIEVYPHMLRHATGYSLANDGTDTRLIQAFVGFRMLCCLNSARGLLRIGANGISASALE